jgi:hypothetical protein
MACPCGVRERSCKEQVAATGIFACKVLAGDAFNSRLSSPATVTECERNAVSRDFSGRLGRVPERKTPR